MMKIGILGGGESGAGTALLARKIGDEPFVSDFRTINHEIKNQFHAHKVRFEESGHSFEILVESDLIVKSPGIPDSVPIVQHLKAEGLAVISELEYAFRHAEGTIIAITGSNGKTTTTNLIHHILRTNGLRAVKGGNLGRSFSRLVEEGEADIYVVEVSSFQLDDIDTFRPQIGLILNITEDHLDRYGGDRMVYARSKMRMCENQGEGDVLLVPSGDELISALLDAESRSFDIFYVNPVGESEKEWISRNPGLRGDHNGMNASFAVEAAVKMGIPRKACLQSLVSFHNDDHRLQTVARINGIEWVNDSKATNVDAARFALAAFDRIIWIAGGTDKGNDYRPLLSLVKDRVKTLICLGKDNEKLLDTFRNFVSDIYQAGSAAEAVMLADRVAEEGDVVLLSPACASFDLFANYEDRGNQFMNEVWNLLRVKNNGLKSTGL